MADPSKELAELLKCVDQILAYDKTFPDVLTGDVPPRLSDLFKNLRVRRREQKQSKSKEKGKEDEIS